MKNIIRATCKVMADQHHMISRISSKMFDNRVLLYFTMSLLLYFLWMDIALFHMVHSMATKLVGGQEAAAEGSNRTFLQAISPFNGLSVKLMMMDQVNNYIHTPLANIFNEATGFSKVFYLITPNMVSFIGLLFAIGSGKCVSIDSRTFHYLAIALFQVRTWMDALDGIVARSRMGMVQHISLRNTTGYAVDGIADTLGFTAFLVGCFYYLRDTLPRQKSYIPLKTSEAFGKDVHSCCGSSSTKVDLSHPPSCYFHKRAYGVVICFGLQLALSAFLWDRYIYAYHNLLETQPNSYSQVAAQTEVIKSSVTWVLMWFWRISNAHTLIQLLLYATGIGKMWDFLLWIQYIGFAQILVLSFFTEIHIYTVKNYIIRGE